MKPLKKQLEEQLKLFAEFLIIATGIGGGVFGALSKAGVDLVLNLFVSLISVGLVLLFVIAYILARNQEELRKANEEKLKDEAEENGN